MPDGGSTASPISESPKVYNLIRYGDKTVIDLTGDTAQAENVLSGYTFHNRTGNQVTGGCTYDADTSDATARAAEILSGKTAYVGGSKITGRMTNRGSVAGTISTKAQTVTILSGYHDGGGKVQISTTEQAKLVSTNIRQGVTILGVPGSMIEASGTILDYITNATSITPTGTYATSTYYNTAYGVKLGLTADGNILLSMRGGTTTAYEYLNFVLGTVPSGVTITAAAANVSTVGAKSALIYACLLSGVPKGCTMSIAMDVVDATYDWTRCTINLTAAQSGSVAANWSVGNVVNWAGYDWRVVHKDSTNCYLGLEYCVDFTGAEDFADTYENSSLCYFIAQFQSNLPASALAQCSSMTVEGVTSKVFAATVAQATGGFSYFATQANRIFKTSSGSAHDWGLADWDENTFTGYYVDYTGYVDLNYNYSSLGVRPFVAITL